MPSFYTASPRFPGFPERLLKFFRKKIGNSHVNKHPKVEYFNLFCYKLLYYFLFIGLPLLVMHLTWWQFLIGYLAIICRSLVLGLVFQLAHVVENTAISHAGENNIMEDSWAVHQLKSTANLRQEQAGFFFMRRTQYAGRTSPVPEDLPYPYP